nr:heavy metal translocating P-type ATPase [uncultured Phascolarctobacterium sp.]
MSKASDDMENLHEHNGKACNGMGHDLPEKTAPVHQHGASCACSEQEHANHSHGGCCGHGHSHDEVHSHTHDDGCGCGTEHKHITTPPHSNAAGCGCGHDHSQAHVHSHEDGCRCGHEHGHGPIAHHVPGHPADCQCEICHPHEEYCDICGESLENCTCRMPDADCVKKVYTLKNLGCANCAAKMEYKIKELSGVEYAAVSFVTKQLRLSAKDHEALLPAIREICTSIESDVEVVPRSGTQPFNFETRVYTLEHLGCANCAAKMEKAINNLPEVSAATITYATKQLRLTAKNHADTLPEVQGICSRIEDGVRVVERTGKTVLAANIEQRKKSGGLLSMSDEQRSLAEIILGGVLFIISEIAGIVPEAWHIYCLVAAYILLGGRIVLIAVKNITKGQVFDENFLMTLATLGAFAIRQYEEAVGVMLFYRIGEYFEHRAVEKSRSQIMDAVDMRPEVVNLLVGEEVRVLPAEEANVGDILLVRVGDRIPLDGVVIEGESLLDTSPVTGEPVPVKRGFGDEVVSGCVNTSGMLKIRVEKILAESMVTKILDSVENAAASKPQLDRFITRFARVYTPVVVAIAVLTALIPGFVTGDWEYWIYTALTFLVISCPCALVLSVPLTFFSGIGAGSKYGILFKGGVTIEALKNVAAVVMDKTGTVTKGNFIVQKLVPSQDITQAELLQVCAAAELVSSHPIANSVVAAAKQQNLQLQRPQTFEEIAGEGLVAETAAGKVLCGNQKLLERFAVDFTVREVADYGTEVLVARDGKYLGQIIIDDTLKDDAVEAVRALKKLRLTTAMLTGDAAASAQAVAQAAGIDEVRAKLLPQDKLNELSRLRKQYGAVMFVGDGINDAPVLAGADVGAAMGSGADAAIEAADVVFMNSEMKSIPQAIAIARETNRIAWQNVIFALVIKVIIMAAGLAGYASMCAAVFADTGVAMLCVLNAIRILYKKV